MSLVFRHTKRTSLNLKGDVMNNKPKSFYDGYESKVVEINSAGFEAARDKLNIDYPRGEKYKGSSEGFYFMQGEAQALSDYFKW